MPTEKGDRRQQSDRRNPRSRRRHAEARSVYVELAGSDLRVAIVVDGPDSETPRLTTRVVRWRFEASDPVSETGRVELAAALSQLVASERLAGCSVSFAISGTLCVSRSASGATARVEQDISDLRERSQLYLSLGPGPKTCAIGRKHIDARHEQALVTVTNESTLDLLVEAAEAAGLVVDAIESALVSLARLQGRLDPDGEGAVLFAQLDEDRFELGVARAGQLLLEYRPASDTTVTQLAGVVDDHYERLQRFCGRQYAVGSLSIDRMWLVGEPEAMRRADHKTRVGLEPTPLPLERIDEFWQVEGGATLTPALGAALGLALRGRFDDLGISPNLMDEVHARAKTPLRPFLVRAAAPIAASLLLAATLWLYNLEQRSELAALRMEVDSARPAELEGKRLTRELIDAASEAENLARLVDRAPRLDVGPIVVRVGQCLPEDVWLKSLRLGEGQRLSLEGASYAESGVYDFVRHLEEAPHFGEVALRGTGLSQTPKGPATSFEINLEMAPAAPAAKRGDRG